ncbi:MAG: GreA/GreB family elongation factor [Candidatus Electryonea clarkiae]|nr:GreA/GreB family elongation factor [Candidatus Electryonea clarkiae]MDP8288234.1 GreA/GreB family elongation factor [Candidatus Electryonea clarkiae]
MKERIQAVRQKLEDEIAEARYEFEVELPIRIEEARSKGDLSENAEYDAAKERQGYVHLRLMQLQHRHKKLSGIDLNDVDPKTVGLYSVVDLKEVESGKEYSYELVLPEEMDIKKGMISIMSPIGQQLRGKSVSETVEIQTPARTFEIKILTFTNILGEKVES